MALELAAELLVLLKWLLHPTRELILLMKRSQTPLGSIWEEHVPAESALVPDAEGIFEPTCAP